MLCRRQLPEASILKYIRVIVILEYSVNTNKLEYDGGPEVILKYIQYYSSNARREIYHGSDIVILFDMQEECIKT